jgi:hypothetical protein
MFLPIGGIFVFGGGGGAGGVALNMFNIVMGALALLFGYVYGILIFKILGYIIGGLGILGLLVSLLMRREPMPSVDEDTGKSSI